MNQNQVTWEDINELRMQIEYLKELIVDLYEMLSNHTQKTGENT